MALSSSSSSAVTKQWNSVTKLTAGDCPDLLSAIEFGVQYTQTAETA